MLASSPEAHWGLSLLCLVDGSIKTCPVTVLVLLDAFGQLRDLELLLRLLVLAKEASEHGSVAKALSCLSAKGSPLFEVVLTKLEVAASEFSVLLQQELRIVEQLPRLLLCPSRR